MIRIKKYKSYKGEQGKIAPNIIQRQFSAERPLQKWATDVTEFSVAGKKLYFSPIIEQKRKREQIRRLLPFKLTLSSQIYDST